MRRLISLIVLAVVAPLAAAVLWTIYLICEVVHARKKAAPMFPISRDQRATFKAETEAIMAQQLADARYRR